MPAGLCTSQAWSRVDPLNVVGRSHDLALHARVWDYRPEHLDHLLYTSREFFDYGGTLYVLPMDELPFWRVHMARRAAEEKSRAFAAEHKQLLEALREDVSSRGPVANRDYAGRGRRGTFRSDKDTARALRHLWLTGELMTYGRQRFERLYALRHDVAPVEVQHAATADEADDFFARKALALLGLATARDWAHRFRHLARRRSDPDGERRRLDELLTSGAAVRTQIGDGPAHYLLRERAKQLEAVQSGSVPRAWRTPRADTLTEATFLPPLEFVTARGPRREMVRVRLRLGGVQAQSQTAMGLLRDAHPARRSARRAGGLEDRSGCPHADRPSLVAGAPR